MLRAVVALAVCAVASTAQSPQNVLIIVADDCGPEMIGCYGGAQAAPTPNLDALAAGGVRFLRAYAAPACTAARAQLMTSRYGFRTGVQTTLFPGQEGLPLREFTLAEALNTISCPNALIGKWHLGDAGGPGTPNAHGWQHFAGTLWGGIANYWSWPRVENGVTTTCTRYCTTQQIDDALAWISARTGPWCLVLSLNAPHSPYHAPPAHLHTQQLAGLDPRVTPAPFFRAMVEAVDSEIGRLIAGLGSAAADTNIVFLADNGTPGEVHPQGRSPLRSKGSLYEGGVRVPMIVRGPAVTVPGSVCGHLVSVVDLLPTVLELFGTTAAVVLPPGTMIDGGSFRPLLRGATAPVRAAVYTENLHTGLGDGYAITRLDAKLVRFTGGGMFGGGTHAVRDELYELATDPDEQMDLLADPRETRGASMLGDLLTQLAQVKRPGSVLRQGDGCTSHPTDLVVYSPPVVGHEISIYVRCTNSSALCVLFLGASDTQLWGLPLPLDLGPMGMPTCWLRMSADRQVFSGPAGARVIVRMPADLGLRGARFYLQAAVIDRGANQAGVIMTPGLALAVGE